MTYIKKQKSIAKYIQNNKFIIYMTNQKIDTNFLLRNII